MTPHKGQLFNTALLKKVLRAEWSFEFLTIVATAANTALRPVKQHEND